MNDDIETLRKFIGISENAQQARDALERVETRLVDLQRCAVQGQEMAKEQMGRCIAAERDRDSLRAKLERAKEALEPFAPINDLPYTDDRTCVIKFYETNGEHIVPGFRWGDFRTARAVLSELSDDAPAQQTHISDEAVSRACESLEWEVNPLNVKRMRAAIAAAITANPRR